MTGQAVAQAVSITSPTPRPVFAITSGSTPGADFTIVALPDTQYYSAKYPQIFTAQTQWIASNRAAQNIQLVLGLGDIVDGNITAQWTNADASVKYLDGVVPYMLAIGNHDYDNGDKAPLKRLVSAYNRWFGPARYAGRPYYKGSFPPGSNENFYGTIALGGKNYLILVLEFFPRNAALDWAQSVLLANADKDAIVVTHAFGYSNARITTCDAYTAENYGIASDNDGEKLWAKLVSQYPNIVLVLSGHEVAYNGVGHRFDLGVNGNLVNQMLSDYQDYVNGGNGYLRLLKFSPANNKISVSTYSPYTGQFLTDSSNQFTVPYRAAPTSTATGTVAGVIYSTTSCAPLAGATVSNGATSALTDQFGNYKLSNLSAGKQTITVRKTGYQTTSKTVSVTAGYTSTAKFAVGISFK